MVLYVCAFVPLHMHLDSYSKGRKYSKPNFSDRVLWEKFLNLLGCTYIRIMYNRSAKVQGTLLLKKTVVLECLPRVDHSVCKDI